MLKIFSTRIKYICLMVLALLGCVIVHPSPSFPDTYSIGGYVTTRIGGYNWSISESSEYLYATRKPPSRSTMVTTGGGLLWTGEFLDDQFMFRQNAGFEAFLTKRFQMTRFSLVNTFAYVPFRSKTFHVWVGPQLNLFYIWGKDTASSVFLYNDYTFNNIPYYKKRTYGFISIGTGLAAGLDYDVYKNLRLSFEGGIQLSTSVSGQSHEVGNGKASVAGYEGYINIAALYRFNSKAAHAQTDDEE